MSSYQETCGHRVKIATAEKGRLKDLLRLAKNNSAEYIAVNDSRTGREVIALEEIAKIAHENNALLSVDNTFASPFNQRPIELGADFAVESLTKYIKTCGSIAGKRSH